MSDQAIEVVRRFWEQLWNEPRPELAAELFAPDATENGEPVDASAFSRAVEAWTTRIFPGFEARIEELHQLAPDRIVSRVTYRGTQAAPWAGLPVSGRSFEAVGIDLFRIADGRIVELWHATDHLEVVLQLGGRIAPGEPAAPGGNAQQ